VSLKLLTRSYLRLIFADNAATPFAHAKPIEPTSMLAADACAVLVDRGQFRGVGAVADGLDSLGLERCCTFYGALCIH
jgi:hypothetical protein